MPPVLVALAALVADASTTTTTEAVPRIVGEPLPAWVVIAASVALLVVILAAGALVNRRLRASDAAR